MADPMTAPRPDLDALEARLLDAERADLLVEHGVRHTDIKWIFAAARERDKWYGAAHDGIDMMADALAAERQRAEQAEQREARLREALVGIRQAIHHPLMRADISDAARAALTEQIDAALAPEQEAQR